MNLKNVADGSVGVNSFAHSLVFMRMNSHLRKQHITLNENNIHHQIRLPE